MVTNKVSMDVKVNSPGGSKARETDGGFSDVLGSVSTESRKQPGLSDSGRNDIRKEFGYTRKAAERPVSERPDVRSANDDRGRSFDDEARAGDAAKVDQLLNRAAETVTRTVSETGEVPSKEEAAEMMTDALKAMSSGNKDDNAAGIPEEIAELLAEAIAAAAGTGSTGAYDGDIPDEFTDLIPDEPAVHVVSPDASFVMTAKHAEAALISGMGAEDPEMTGEENAPELDSFMSTLRERMPDLPEGDLRPADSTFEERAKSLLQRLADMPEEPYDPLKSEFGIETGFGYTENLSAVKDTAEMLSDLIEGAKKELGLSEVKYEHITETETPEAILMHDEPMKLSHSMNSRDRTGELDHILGEGRFDVSEEDGDAPKTQTYDAVHMSAELMGSRTDTDIPVENEQMPEQTAEIRPPEVQTAEQILERIQNMQGDRTEFTMVLNPEALGRITVKLVMTGERASVEINAENPETRAILAARTENLQSVLHDNGVELENYQVVTEQENTQYNEQNYDGSSKNPYSRDDEDSQNDDDNDDGENFYDILQNI
jgi:flagellar hook-length control protein FliK